MPREVASSLDSMFFERITDEDLLKIQASEFIKITDNQNKIL